MKHFEPRNHIPAVVDQSDLDVPPRTSSHSSSAALRLWGCGTTYPCDQQGPNMTKCSLRVPSKVLTTYFFLSNISAQRQLSPKRQIHHHSRRGAKRNDDSTIIIHHQLNYRTPRPGPVSDQGNGVSEVILVV
jgi:hypothetical protein